MVDKQIQTIIEDWVFRDINPTGADLEFVSRDDENKCLHVKVNGESYVIQVEVSEP